MLILDHHSDCERCLVSTERRLASLSKTRDVKAYSSPHLDKSALYPPATLRLRMGCACAFPIRIVRTRARCTWFSVHVI